MSYIENSSRDFTAGLTATGVELAWGWGKLRKFRDMVGIQVDYAAGWVQRAFHTTPGYDDTESQPAALLKWKYRINYRGGDERVDQSSAEIDAGPRRSR